MVQCLCFMVLKVPFFDGIFHGHTRLTGLVEGKISRVNHRFCREIHEICGCPIIFSLNQSNYLWELMIPVSKWIAHCFNIGLPRYHHPFLYVCHMEFPSKNHPNMGIVPSHCPFFLCTFSTRAASVMPLHMVMRSPDIRALAHNWQST